MERRKVSHHSSDIIIQEKGASNFLLHAYDEGYPQKHWRGKVKLIGGNYNPGKRTHSPEALFHQQMIEEFSSEQDTLLGDRPYLDNVVGTAEENIYIEIAKFAPSKDIARILGEILINSKPYKDFVTSVPEIEGRKGFNAVSSVFYAELSKDLFDLIRENLSQGRAIRNEGITQIVSADDLISGKVGTAREAGQTLSHLLEKSLPNPYKTKSDPLGPVRSHFADYVVEFDYATPVI